MKFQKIDKKTRTVTFRVSKKLSKYLQKLSEYYEISESEILRQLILKAIKKIER